MRRKTLWSAASALFLLALAIPPVQAAPLIGRVARPVGSRLHVALCEAGATAEFMQPQTDGDVPTMVPAKRWILQLEDPPLALYAGGIAGLEATGLSATDDRLPDLNAIDAQGYIAYLEAKQSEVAAAVRGVVAGADVECDHQVVFNGPAGSLPEADERAGR